MTNNMRAITAKYIFDGVNLLDNHTVLIENNVIADVIDTKDLYDKSKLEDFGDCVISAGFIDLQLNGCGGVLFNDDISCATLEIMHQTNLKSGCTSFLPTLITSSIEDVKQSLVVVKEWFTQFSNSRGVIGIHLEGPFLSLVKKGIHPQEFIISPQQEILDYIVQFTKYFPIKMTIAPENFTAEQIKFLVKNGIVVSLGHSNATFEQSQVAIDNGASTATHLFNAMSGFTGRNPGLIGALLANSIYSGIIVDLLHVDKHNINLISRLKPTTTYLVTDAVTPTGTSMTEFDFAGKHLYVKEGKCVDDNGTLGGAFLTMSESIANCVESCNIELAQALAMATIVPAQVMSLDNIIGRVAKGYRANLVALNLANYSTLII